MQVYEITSAIVAMCLLAVFGAWLAGVASNLCEEFTEIWEARRSAKRYAREVNDLKRHASAYIRMRLHRVIQRIAEAEAGTYGQREAAMVVMGCVRDNKKHTA